VVSYFRGGPDDWKPGLETFGEGVYADLWPGIDLVYRGAVDKLKYEFVVRPGADPRKIRLRYRGAEAVRLTDAGALRVETPLGTGTIPIGNRTLGLSPDPLLSVSVNGYWPWMFASYRGFIDSRGHASAAIHLPNLTALRGLRIHTAFVTLSPPAPWGIKSISNTFSFTVQ
jgi:hypothetical protein